MFCGAKISILRFLYASCEALFFEYQMCKMSVENDYKVLLQIIRNRRSVYPLMFSDERVEDDTVLELLDQANWAPNHKKTEPWRFHVLSGGAKDMLGKKAGEWYVNNHNGDAYSAVKHKKIMSNPLRASHVIAICMTRDPEGRLPQWHEEAAVACAVQNLWLAVSAKGLGGFWSTPPFVSIVEELIDMEDGEHCMGMFYLGVPQPDLHLEASRGAIQDKVKWYR